MCATFGLHPDQSLADEIRTLLETALLTETSAKLMVGFHDKSLNKVALRKYVQSKLRGLKEAEVSEQKLDPRILAKISAALLLK